MTGHGPGSFDAIAPSLGGPMIIVTTAGGGRRAGCLVGFATQAGIDPPRFLVCLSVVNRTYRVARNASHLAVHVLAAGQRPLAELFGSRTGDGEDKFARCAWTEGPHGLPILRDAPAWFTGRIVSCTDFGDHQGFLLAPEDGDAAGLPQELLTLADASGIEPGHP